MRVTGVKWSFILLSLIFGTTGCLVDMIVDPIIEKHAQETVDKNSREMEQKMGWNKPLPVTAWDNSTSLVIVSYGPWRSHAFMVEEKNLAKGVAQGIIGGALFLSRSDFYEDVTPGFQAGIAKILSREKLQEIQARLNERLVQELKVTLGFPIKAMNMDMNGNMVAQSLVIAKEWQPGAREVTVMPTMMFFGKTPAMRAEVTWSFIKEPAAFEKGYAASFKGASTPPPGWQPPFRPDAIGKASYKSASHSPSEWLEGSGALLIQELNTAADQLAMKVAQALSGNPTRQ
jgi:hypothetical protein